MKISRGQKIYKNFLKINGDHPWRDVSPEGYVNYPVRYRKGGRVLFFNFPLAREMGLIARNHPDVMTGEGRILRNVAERSSVINYIYRSTGDGLSWIIHETIQLKDRIKRQELQDIIDRFIESQVLVPGKWNPFRQEEVTGRSMKARYLRRIQQTLEMYHELI